MLKIIEAEVMIDGEGFTQRSGAAQVKYVVLSGEAAHDILNWASKGKLRGKLTGREAKAREGQPERKNKYRIISIISQEKGFHGLHGCRFVQPMRLCCLGGGSMLKVRVPDELLQVSYR